MPDEQPQPQIGRSRVEVWVAEAFTRTVVDRIDSPPRFLADCVVAPGAITVGGSEQQARDEMRSALADWANLRAARGYDLPQIIGLLTYRAADQSAASRGHKPTRTEQHPEPRRVTAHDRCRKRRLWPQRM